jgi:hypothetical protein
MNNTISSRHTQLVDLVLQDVARPKYRQQQKCVAEITSLESERVENVERSAALPSSDPKLLSRRRDIDFRLEELYAKQVAMQPEIVEETARLLEGHKPVMLARDVEAQSKTREAKEAYDSLERAGYEAAKAVDAASKSEQIVHGQGWCRLHDAIRAFADANPEYYSGNPPTPVVPEVET